MNQLLIAVKRLGLFAEGNPQGKDWGRKCRWLVLVSAMVAAASIAVSLGQDCSWDVLNYHFYSGYAFLAKPLNYDIAPAQRQSFFNPLMHVLSYLLLAHLPSILVCILLGAIQGLNFWLVFQISRVLFRHWPDPFHFLLCLCNAVTGCYSSIFILELGTTFGDSLISLLILSGLLLIFRYLISVIDSTPVRNSLLGIAGAILGIAFGLKFTAAIYLAAIAVALFVTLRLLNGRIRPMVIFFAFMGLGFAVVYGIWGYSLYREYQSPVFPFMNSVFHSPYHDSMDLVDARFFSRTWQQGYFYPFFFARKNTLVSEISFRDIRLAFCYIAIVTFAAVGLFHFVRGLFQSGEKRIGRQSSPILWFLILFFSVSYLLWQNQFSVYRYLIVLELLAPAFLALALANFIRTRVWVVISSLLLDILICAFMVPANFGRQKFDDNFLKAEIPTIGDLDKSMVVMSGGDATSFIIPYFPAETRFVRIFSNFSYPGQNVHLDNKILGILAKHDARHTLVLISESQDREQMRKDLGFYGVKVDDQSCRAVLRQAGDVGYLCGIETDSWRPPKTPKQQSSAEPVFKILSDVQLEISPKVAGENDIVQLHVLGGKLNLKALDLLYTINGDQKPPQRRFFLDERQFVSFPIIAATPKGLYHFIGIRNSAALDSDPWIKVDARLLIR
jgi:hypothetical protein